MPKGAIPLFELKVQGCKVWAFVVLGHGKSLAVQGKWLAIQGMSGNRKKGERLAVLWFVGFGAIALLSAGVWALQ